MPVKGIVCALAAVTVLGGLVISDGAEAAKAAKGTEKTRAGMASWYSHGTRTASGARFNPNAMTAAHRSLPFGTKVRVKHRLTGRTVDVTINDRGPFIRGRVIDLSRQAAMQLGITKSGVGPVELDVIR